MNASLINLLKNCVPELDISLTLHPEICEICANILYKWNDFKITCLNTDTLIKKYCTTFSIKSDNIQINELLEFVKMSNWQSMSTTEYTLMQNNVKMEFGCIETSLQTHREDVKEVEEENQIDDLDQSDHNIKIILESVETVLKPMKRNGIWMYTCPKCNKIIKHIDTHLKEHGEHLKLSYQCYKCDYKNKSKIDVKEHLLTHDQGVPDRPYNCDQCSFSARQKGNLMTHLLVHKSPGEIKMFQCRLCKFQTRQKGNLKTHLLVHKKPDEIHMFKCNICTYQARQKGNLQTHLLKKHKNFDETALEEALFYKCSKCSYKVKQKPSLKKHMLIHNS